MLLQDEEMEMLVESQSQEEEDSSIFQFQQFYLVISHNPFDEDSEISIYRIDVSNSSSTNSSCSNSSIQSLQQPIMSVYDDDINRSVFVVFGHTLYIFGGIDLFLARKKSIYPYWVDKVRKLDLKDAAAVASRPCPRIDTSRLAEVKHPMNGRKCEPQAVVIDGTRICIFPLVLYDENECPDDTFSPHTLPNFELFDTITESWTQLPEPILQYNYTTCYLNQYYTSRSTLIISTTHGCYKIKFNVPNPSWEKIWDDGPTLRDDDFPISGMYMIGEKLPFDHGLVISPFHSVLWQKFAKPLPILHKANGERKDLVDIAKDGLLFLKDGYIYILRIGYNEELWRNLERMPFLLLDIYKNDSELATKLSDAKEIEAVKSFTFSLDSLCRNRITVEAFFPLKKLKRTQSVETLQNKRFCST